ncbi:MAG TPA: hypothetical protein VK780_06645, partial [Thermoanaerobaculia bacterium]|nr:hypothetical protein [Thermoanaerobaculia bacterium]
PGPFDFQRPTPAPPPPRATTPGPVNLVPNPISPSSDIFSPRNQVPTQPPTTPAPRPFNEAVAVSVSSVSFDFDPSSVTLAPGQQRSILVRGTGDETLVNTSIAIRFDPAVVAAVAVRPILSETGVADAHIEKGRVVIEIPSAVALSGTRAFAEITLAGIAPGKSSLAFEKAPSDGAATSSAAVEVK